MHTSISFFTGLCLLALCSVQVNCANDDQKAIKLNPDIITIIDGTSFGIHGELVGAVYKIARDVRTMQFGRRTATGFTGTYVFAGQPHSIKTLIAIEKRAIDGTNQAALKELAELLKIMKHDFRAIVGPFMGQARGAKEPMFLLISESCTKRNRPNSLLLTWARANGTDDMEVFDQTVTSFALFDGFCTDLINFLGDLLGSCPKARAQFEKLKAEYIRKQGAQ